jgi:signal transduction histidine kinase
LIAWYGANDDIDDRRRAETELRLNEERYRELFNYTPVGLLEIDARKRTEMLADLHRAGVTNVEAYLNAHPDFEQRAIGASIIKHVNPRTVEMLGAREAGELIGLSTARLLTLSADALRRGTVSRFRGEKLFEHEIKVETLDGRMIDVLMTVARPDISRNFLALTDITKRKAADEALRDSERRYRQLFEFVPLAIWQVDLSRIAELMDELHAEGVTDLGEYLDQQPDALDRMIGMLIAVDVNESALKMFAARDRGELLGPCRFHWRTSPETFRHAMVALFRGEDLFQEETVFTALDGRRINALFAMARGIVGIVDVTDRTAALERLQRLQAELARGARISMLGELAASIAHEVNQPLAAIQTRSDTALRLLDRPEPDVAKLRELARRNVADAHRAADVIARIRTMAAGREPERTKLSLHEVIEESLVFLRNELQSNAVSVALDLAPLPLQVIGDRIQLQQVVVNLIVNAVQAMAQSAAGRRALLVRTRLSDDKTIGCTFEDSGPGIDPLHLNRLFDSFFTTKDTGMGMGLPVSRSIVEAHDGVLKADNGSELGGARFSFSLPVCE